MRRELRAWRRGTGEEGEYKRAKKKYRELCERKKREENERWEKVVEVAKQEGQVWEVVNRERKKWKRINEQIEEREWEEYFKNLLGGGKER